MLAYLPGRGAGDERALARGNCSGLVRGGDGARDLARPPAGLPGGLPAAGALRLPPAQPAPARLGRERDDDEGKEKKPKETRAPQRHPRGAAAAPSETARLAGRPS